MRVDVAATKLGDTLSGVTAATGFAALLAVGLRLPFLGDSVHADEGGYLIVAGQWHPGGPFSYGDLFVDRPPLLLLIYRVAYLAGGVEPLRLIACVFVVVMVVSAGWSGWLVAGSRGAWSAALVAAALMSTPLLGTHEVDGELLAAPLVTTGCTLTLMALRPVVRHRSQLVWMALAGVAGTAAVLVKQNFLDALVFAAVAVAVSGFVRRLPGNRVAALLGALAVGVGLPLGVVAWWAVSWGPGLGTLWFAIYGFRADAAQVVMTHSLSAPEARLRGIALLALLSGIVVLAVVYVVSQHTRLRRGEPVALATAAMLVTALAGVVLGMSYWAHYLIQFAPALVLATAVMSYRSARRRIWPAVTIGAIVGSSVVSSLVSWTAGLSSSTTEADIENWLSAAALPTDSLTVTYGHANVVYATGLRPTYPYLWSLPLRTLDPRLHLLERDLSRPHAPVWLVEWEGFDSWQIDSSGALAALVAKHYHPVTDICGVRVFLRDGYVRPAPRPPRCPSQ